MFCDAACERQQSAMLRTNDLNYDLPEALIADRPICAGEGAGEPGGGISRDAARLMVVPRVGGDGTPSGGEGRAIEHRQVRDLPTLLRRGDLLVFNTSRVIPARLVGFKRGASDASAAKSGWGGKRADPAEGGGRVEGLYLADEASGGVGGASSLPSGGMMSGQDARSTGVGHAPAHATWRVLLKGPRLRPGTLVRFQSPDGRASVDAELLRKLDADEEGPSPWLIRVTRDDGPSDANNAPSQWLEEIGHTPLPPYILKRRAALSIEAGVGAGAGVPDALDREWYQTVVATDSGSVAAPTAGLHFTPSLLQALEAAGIGAAHVQLHVGLGTFRPVQAEHVEEHPMHAESCRVPAEAARAIEAARGRGGRIIAVGTTAARTLEAWAAGPGAPPPLRNSERPLVSSVEPDPHGWFDTRLLITPGYPWRVVDGLLTNFHLPRTTLMAMVAARLDPQGATASGEQPSPGVRRLLEAYRLAVACRYRFFSYGDAMLVLP